MAKVIIGSGKSTFRKKEMVARQNAADVNNDGKVDEKDLSIVHKEYQKAKKAITKKAAPKKKAATKKPFAKKGKVTKKK